VLVTLFGDKPLLTLFCDKVCRTEHFFGYHSGYPEADLVE